MPKNPTRQKFKSQINTAVKWVKSSFAVTPNIYGPDMIDVFAAAATMHVIRAGQIVPGASMTIAEIIEIEQAIRDEIQK